MKSKLRAQRRALEELWRQGLSGHALLARQSRLVDDYIIDHFADDPGVALVALGGYGRDELFPFSDVDLLILFAPEAEGRIGEVADRILYPLWDAGLEVGHGVRTVEQCMEHGAEEFFFQVALLDSRLICGDAALYGELSERFQSCFLEGGRVDFVTRLKELRNGRQGRFGSHSYLLEPQIKEGRGGMRDIQSMFWVGKVVFGLGGLDEMVSGGILLEEERRLFEESWNLLVKVRNRLHYISGRKNDQLFFEQQEEVAANFGYRKGKELLAVEGFMRDLYGHLRTIGATVDFFFEHVEEVLGVGLGLGAPENSVVEKGVELRGDRLHLTASPAELSAKPHLLMRLFLASARTGAPVHYRSRQKVSANIGLLTGKVCSSPRMGRPFVEILTRGKDVLAVLEVMLDCGMLSAYIPEYSKILSLAQHDLYHIYTVDRHLLQTVAELRRLEVEEEGIFAALAEPELLYLAALFHDLGKGSGMDHSVYGAEVVIPVGSRLGLDREGCDSLSFLVRYHLFFPENALRRDLNDQDFIRQCSEVIGDVDRLAMLYLLSIADSRATGPSAWSDWKGTLLHEMFLKVRSYLEVASQASGAEGGEAQLEQGVAWLRQRVAELLGKERGDLAVPEMGDDYLLSFTPEAVVDHIRRHVANENILRQKVVVVPVKSREGWSLLVLGRDRAGLLAKICGVLALYDLNILNAEIFTWGGGEVVDLLELRPTVGTESRDRDWQRLEEDLNLALAHRLGLGHRLYKKLSGRYGTGRIPSGRVEPRVEVRNDVSATYTVVEVFGEDRPGCLYHITQALADFGINIHKAFIATEVEQLIDVFYVLDDQGGKIDDKGFVYEIKEGLLYAATVSI